MLTIKEINEFSCDYKGVMSDIPLDGLTAEIQDIIRQFAGEQHAPTNYVAAALLTAFGSIIGKRTKVVDGGWDNYLNFYTCLVGYSTDGKSPACRPVLKPIKERDAVNYKKYSRELNHFNNLSPEEKRTESKPLEYRVMIDNATTEKVLQTLFCGNDVGYGGLLAYPDELETMFGNLDRYSSGSSIGYYLRMWEAETIRVDRVYDELGKLIENPFLSILGGIQPSILRKVFSGYYGNGFFPRWTFVQPNKKLDRIEKNEIHHKYWAEIVEITSEVSSLDVTSNGNFPPIISLSQGTKTLIDSNDEYREMISEHLKRTNPELSEMIMKQNYVVRRLSGLVHMLNALSKKKEPTGVISEQEYLYAEELDDFFLKCAVITQKQMHAERIEKMGTKELLLKLNELHPITNISAFSEGLGGKPTKQYISKCLLNKDTTEIEKREKDANEVYPLILNYISENCKSLVKIAGIPTLEEFRDCMMLYGDYSIKEVLGKLNSDAEKGKISSDGTYTHTFDFYARAL